MPPPDDADGPVGRVAPSGVRVTGVRVDDEGIRASSTDEVILDVVFDDRRIWSFHLHRDGHARGLAYFVPWPKALRRFLDGSTRLTLVQHVSQEVVHDEEVRLGAGGDQRIAVVNERGLPLGIDKSLRLAQTFDTRSAEHVAPLLDSIEEVLTAIRKAGVEAFPAYGTLLGAVRGGRLIGFDSDADLGYVSEHSHPVDVVRESFRLQRTLVEMGYWITRYSGAAFKVDVREADGSVRGLDVFGGFLGDGNLHLMGEIITPFRREWVYPLGTCTLEGRTLPAPADTDRFLTATYGPAWRVPDPAYKFPTPKSTHRRFNGWFRGTRVNRENWDRTYSRAHDTPVVAPSELARMVVRREHGVPATVVDLGCGRGVDALWFARQGASVLGYDYVPRGSEALAAVAADEDVDLEFRRMNLCELRSVLTEGARVAELPGPKIVVARHLLDATDRATRHRLWRACDMMLRGGGRLYLEFMVSRGRGDPFARRQHVHAVPVPLVVRELEGRGATVLTRRVVQAAAATAQTNGMETSEVAEGHRIGRVVAQWRR